MENLCIKIFIAERGNFMEHKNLQIPKYFNSEFVGDSKIKAILESEDWQNEMREIYKKDSKLFFDIRDELLIKGFEFSKEIQNNYFPQRNFEIHSIIRSEEDGEKFLNINSEVTGINTFINRYDIKSDFFFNFISIEGLAESLGKNPDFISQNFRNNGFDVYSIKDYEKGLKNDMKKNQFNRENIGSSDALIKNWFKDTKFRMFVEFCEERKYEKISNVSLDIIDEFSEQPGVGKKKVEDVISKFNEFQDDLVQVTPKCSINIAIDYFCSNPIRTILELNDQSYEDFINKIYDKDTFYFFDEKVNEFKSVLPELQKNAIEKIKIKQIDEYRKKIKELSAYKQFKNFRCTTINEILNLNIEIDSAENIYLYEIIEDDNYALIFKKLFLKLENYQSISKVLMTLINKLKDRELDVLELRINNFTLEECGEKFGVTRERVRQIEKKAINKIKKTLDDLKIDKYIEEYFSHQENLSLEDIFEYLEIDEKSEIFMRYYISSNPKFEIRNNFVIDKELTEYIKVALSTLKKEKFILFVEEIYALMNDGKYDISLEKLDAILCNLEYKRIDDIYIYSKVPLANFIMHLFKYKIKKEVELNEDNFIKINKLMKETFGIEFESGKRAAIARIRDTKNIILVDSNTFMYFDLDKVPKELIEEIEEKLEECLSNTNTTIAATLFGKNRSLWNSYKINSHMHLYSIIQYYFSEQYQIGRGNTLSITKLNQKVESAYDTLKNLLNRFDKILSKQEILDYLKWPPYKLDQLVAYNSDLMLIELPNQESGVKLFSSYEFTEEEIKTIKDFLDQFITKDYVYTQDLMIEMEFEDELGAILADKGIENLYDFASLIKCLREDLRGFPQFLCKKGSNFSVIEDAIFEEFPRLINRHKLQKFFEEKGYSNTSFTSLIKDLINKKYFYQYTLTEYINAKCLNVSDEALGALNEYLKEIFTEKEYISIYDLTGFTKLPKISDYQWTPHLVANIGQVLGYSIINTVRDYRFDKYLLVPPESKFKKLDELAYKLIKEEYKGNSHESDIAKFLEQRKLIHTSNINYLINSSRLFTIDKLGFVTLQEV